MSSKVLLICTGIDMTQIEDVKEYYGIFTFYVKSRIEGKGGKFTLYVIKYNDLCEWDLRCLLNKMENIVLSYVNSAKDLAKKFHVNHDV